MIYRQEALRLISQALCTFLLQLFAQSRRVTNHVALRIRDFV